MISGTSLAPRARRLAACALISLLRPITCLGPRGITAHVPNKLKASNAHSGAFIAGERLVTDAVAMAEEMIEEAECLWASTDGWKVKSESSSLKIESKPIGSGPYAESGLVVIRGTGIIKNASARDVIDRVATPEGFAAISPVIDSSRPPLEVYPWKDSESMSLSASMVSRGGGLPGTSLMRRLEAKLNTLATPPFMNDREFVVLNAIDPHRLMCGSKSVLHPSQPGASSYITNSKDKTRDGRIRAVAAFYIKTEPIEDSDDQCRIHYISFMDPGGSLPKRMVNTLSAKFGLQDMHRRISALVKK